MNRDTSSTNTPQAGSWSSTMWLLLSRGTSRASGMCEASVRESSKSFIRSSTECRIKVGIVSRGRSSVASARTRCCRALNSDVGRDRHPLELVEPGHLLLGRARDHQRGEHPPELRGRPRPADLDDPVDGLLHLEVLARRVRHRGGVRAVEDDPGDAVGMGGDVADRHRPALGHRHHREPVDPAVLDHGLQVADPGLEREVLDVAVGQAVPAFVVPDHRGHLTEVAQEVPPHRALPVVLQVAEPAGRDHQRRPGAVHGVRDPHAVGGAAEPHVLVRPSRCSPPAQDRRGTTISHLV